MHIPQRVGAAEDGDRRSVKGPLKAVTQQLARISETTGTADDSVARPTTAAASRYRTLLSKYRHYRAQRVLNLQSKEVA